MIRQISLALSALAVATLFSIPANAQNNIPPSSYQAIKEAAQSIYDGCKQVDIGASSEGCACLAGYFGGALTESEFDIASRIFRIGVLVEQSAPEEDINQEIQAFALAGYTEADINHVMAKIESITAKGDAVCSPFENQSVSS